MSSVQEIENAIRALPAEDREILAERLSSILPEINGDAEWDRIINDPTPSPALSALGDTIAAQIKADPNAFPDITEKDFEGNR